jgi:hypothetical protein
VGRLFHRISAQTGIQRSNKQKRHNPAFYIRTMRRAVRAKQESEKLVLDDKYVGDSLKSQIDAHAWSYPVSVDGGGLADDCFE